MRLRAYNPINRARWALLTLLFVVSQFGPLTLLGGRASAATAPVANPALSQACGLDIAIVIDNSLSISSSEMTDFKNALKSFTNALSGTPTQFSVTKFNTSATVLQNFTSNVTSVNLAIDSVSTSSGYTNWEDALIKVNSTFSSGTSNPNLVIFATDGDPTTSNTFGGLDTNQPNAHLDPAIIAANTIKNGVTRMLALGIGITGSSLDRLKSISGPNANTGSVLTSDVITTSNFSTLATNLATFASQTCGGTITVSKFLDVNGVETPAGAGWEFDISGGSNPAPVQTASNGKTPAVKVDAASGYGVNETQKQGYVLLSASCTTDKGVSKGTKNGDAVTGITIAANEIVSCKFVNKIMPGIITVNKNVVNGYGLNKQAKDFKVSNNGGTSVAFVNKQGDSSKGSQTFTIPAGAFNIVEDTAPGYETTYSPECSGTVAANETKTCTITNTALPATLIIEKQVVNDNGGTKTASNFKFKVNNGTATSFTENQQDSLKGKNVLQLSAGNYGVTEDQANQNGYTTSYSAGCSTSRISNGETKTCVITNDDKAVGLTLVKNLIKDNGGTANATDWTLKATGTKGTNLSGATGTAGATSGSDFKADTYTLSEADGPSGYTSEGWACTNGVIVSENSTITLANGQSTTCTVTNNDDAPGLTLIKELVDNFGGGLKSSAWKLTATGPSTIEGQGEAKSGADFKAGEYKLAESGPSTGFTSSDWSCVEASAPNTNVSVKLNQQLSIALGQQFTCTITNTAQPANLTVKKVLDNSNGGTKSADGFSFSVNEDDAIWFNENGENKLELAKGTYTVTETQENQNGYETKYEGCTEVAISNGETKTCTITNTAKAPHLSLYKDVINNNSGESEPSDWTLTATPADDSDFKAAKISGNGEDGVVDVAAKANVTYTLSESGPKGYTQGDWRCEGGELNGNELTLALGEDVTCWITNDDEAHPGIHVYKYGPDTAHEGDTITYTFWVHNSGDTYLADLSVIDDIAGKANCFGVTSLDAGEWTLCTATYTVPKNQTEDVTNIVKACAFYEEDREEMGQKFCATDTHTLDVLHPAIKVVKTGPATAKPGEVVTYTFTVTNTGDEPLDSVVVNDNIAGAGTYKSGDTNEDGVLDTTETWVYSAQYTIPADAGGKQIVNTAKVCGTELVSEDQEESVNVYSMLELNQVESDAVVQPKDDDAITVCATDSHTTSVEKPQELVNTGTGNLTFVGYMLAATMLGGVFLANRRQTKTN